MADLVSRPGTRRGAGGSGAASTRVAPGAGFVEDRRAMAATSEPAPGPDHSASGGGRLLAAAALGAIVALSLGIYGNVHEPATDLAITLGFHDTITMKVWLASVAVLFALFQLFSALWMWGRLPLGAVPEWIGTAHRVSARLAFLFSLQ